MRPCTLCCHVKWMSNNRPSKQIWFWGRWGWLWPSKHANFVVMNHCRNKGVLWEPYTPSTPPKIISVYFGGYDPFIWHVGVEHKASCRALGGHFHRWRPRLWQLWRQLCVVVAWPEPKPFGQIEPQHFRYHRKALNVTKIVPSSCWGCNVGINQIERSHCWPCT
jgi:hypothetical protein